MKAERFCKFNKISLEKFYKSYKEFFQEKKIEYDDLTIKNIYYDLKLPKRATTGSAGYDFFTPIDLIINPKETITIPTGINVQMSNDLVLLIFPRSSLGFKYNFILDNTVGVIDSDYFFSDNEGHIQIKLTNHSNKVLTLLRGQAFSQGIFLNFYLTDDDNVDKIRNGGIGSTNEL